MSLRHHTYSEVQQGCQAVLGSEAGVLLLWGRGLRGVEGGTAGRWPASWDALMGVAPINGLWKRHRHPETKAGKAWGTWVVY